MIRPATAVDHAAMAEILALSPEAASWVPSEEPTLVFEANGLARAFLVWRPLPGNEAEILNLAVHPAYRRRGIASTLVRDLCSGGFAAVYLELRESNLVARRLYEAFNFQPISRREAYYNDPPEAAVVMRLTSC
jgi:ribosomal-protein-alanine N-acetyltransferase